MGDSDMAEKRSAFQLRLDKEAHRKVKAIADKELRSLNAQIEYFVYRGIAEYEDAHGTTCGNTVAKFDMEEKQNGVS